MSTRKSPRTGKATAVRCKGAAASSSAAAAATSSAPAPKQKRAAAATAASNKKRSAPVEESSEDDEEEEEGEDDENEDEEEDEGALLLSYDGPTAVLTYSGSKRVHYRGAVAPVVASEDDGEDKDDETPSCTHEPHGLGQLFFADGSSLAGVFVHGQIDGVGTYEGADGSKVTGPYVEGVLNGQVVELDDEGTEVFRGAYADSVRQGHGTVTLPDGGKLVGNFNAGVFEGHNNKYVYPPALAPLEASLRGEWKNGEMIKARFYLGEELGEKPEANVDGEAAASPAAAAPAAAAASRSNKRAKTSRGAAASSSSSSTAAATSAATAASDVPCYTFDESTALVPSSQPLLRDPYESLTVRVADSSIPNSGEGLFARVDLPADTIVTFYSGTRDRGDKSERRRWAENSNTIALIDDDPDAHAEGVDIDVSEAWATTATYAASLAHKCNHIFDLTRQNARYDMCLHPRFGLIKSVRTTRPVPAGQELLVDYGYTLKLDARGNVKGNSGGPDWYKKAYTANQKRLAEEEEAAARNGGAADAATTATPPAAAASSSAAAAEASAKDTQEAAKSAPATAAAPSASKKKAAAKRKR